jgi:hypothetical protein
MLDLLGEDAKREENKSHPERKIKLGAIEHHVGCDAEVHGVELHDLLVEVDKTLKEVELGIPASIIVHDERLVMSGTR